MSDAIKSLLIQLETELKQQRMWSAVSPDPDAIASKMPFCCDTLPLEQWLQFIFLPRLWALLDAGLVLPAKVSILPYAEEAFQAEGVRLQPLLTIIGQLDNTLTGEQ